MVQYPTGRVEFQFREDGCRFQVVRYASNAVGFERFHRNLNGIGNSWFARTAVGHNHSPTRPKQGGATYILVIKQVLQLLDRLSQAGLFSGR